MERMDRFKDYAVAEALALAACNSAPTRERGMAARVAAEILDHVEWTEARAASVMEALLRCVHGRFDPFSAVDALVDIVRRKGSRTPEKALPALVRVARRAYDQSFWMTLHVLLVAMLDEDAWSASVQPDWLETAVRRNLARAVSRDTAGEILHLYLAGPGAADDAWLRRVVRDHPRLLESHWLDCQTKQALQRAAPTAAGFTFLAELDAQDLLKPWEPAGFGSELPAAVATLGEAIAASQSDGASARSVILAGWLSRLLGPA